jgi:hypothetical protein
VTVPDVSEADLMGSVRTPWHGFADAATKARFDRERAAAEGAARRYATADRAARDGYVLASYFVPHFGVHWINWSLVTRPFDPAHPAMLLYDGEGRHAHLVGLSYYVRSPGAAPPGFAGDNDRWHRHFGTCYSGGFLIGEGIATSDGCAKRCSARDLGAIRAPVGTPRENDEIDAYLTAHPEPEQLPRDCAYVPGTDLWMLHLWTVAGHRNPDGLFSTMNPAVSACVSACRRL